MNYPDYTITKEERKNATNVAGKLFSKKKKLSKSYAVTQGQNTFWPTMFVCVVKFVGLTDSGEKGKLLYNR